jgi:threonine dehydrogenase-like Zn-dependent dehydrogenase
VSAGARHESCLVWLGEDRVQFTTRARPQADRPYVIADVLYAGVCGSDLHQYRGGPGPRRPPLILGHEAVVSVEGRDGRFVVFPLVCCGGCDACARGEENLCERRGLIGLDRPGVFADSVVVDEASLVAVPDGMDPRVAVLTEPLAASVSAMRIAGVTASTRLAVIGCGPIGLMAVHAAAHSGVHAIVADPLASRRAIALRLGAHEALPDPTQLSSQGADIVLDAAGTEAAWSAGIAAVRSGGCVVVLGLAQAEGTVPVGALVRRGVTLRGHYAYTRADFDAALALLADSPPPLDWLDFAGLADGAESFRRIVHSPAKVTKVILTTDRAARENRAATERSEAVHPRVGGEEAGHRSAPSRTTVSAQ